ncbi:MAG: hypothetical protein KFF68_04920 [Desulfosarcina sp.]|nr:hypothetical protein [Desulfosarcina sp.]
MDNGLVIAIFVGRLPEHQRQKARIVGLSVAMIARIVMLAVVAALASLTRPIVANFSVRDLILLAAGCFRSIKPFMKSTTPLSKAYIYRPLGFALMVAMLQMRYVHNRCRTEA